MDNTSRTVHSWRPMTHEEIIRFLQRHSHGRLGLCVEDEPYVVPVAYAYSKGAIYFHTAKHGKKVDLMRQNSKVCFEIDEWHEAWASVICYGKVTLDDSLEAKGKGFELLTGQRLADERIGKAAVYIGTIGIEEIPGRCSIDFPF